MKFYCDNKRHLVCVPYSVENLHEMAHKLGIKKCWYHSGDKPHYDIPKRRLNEVTEQCEIVSTREIYNIIKGD